MRVLAISIICLLNIAAAVAALEIPYTWPVVDGPHLVNRRDGSIAACYLVMKVDPNYEQSDDPSYLRFNDIAGIAWCQARTIGQCITVLRGPTCTMVIDGAVYDCLVALPGSGQVEILPEVCEHA